MRRTLREACEDAIEMAAENNFYGQILLGSVDSFEEIDLAYPKYNMVVRNSKVYFTALETSVHANACFYLTQESMNKSEPSL